MTVNKGCGLPAYIVLVFLVVGYLAWQWSETLGGAAGLSEKFGGMAPLVTIPLHLLLSATPFPSETIGVGKHAQGIAADIKYNSSFQAYMIVKNALEMGFNGVGIAKTFIHVDTRKDVPKMWSY